MFTAAAIASALLMCGVVATTLCGGVSAAPLTDEVRKMVADHKEEIEAKLNEKFAIFNPVEMTQQVVAGMNYRVKIDIGDNKAIFVKFYDRFGDVSVTEVLTGKTLADTLSPY
ncbi:hypothetical protein WA538_005968 [Blastocystis sp. DL]